MADDNNHWRGRPAYLAAGGLAKKTDGNSDATKGATGRSNGHSLKADKDRNWRRKTSPERTRRSASLASSLHARKFTEYEDSNNNAASGSRNQSGKADTKDWRRKRSPDREAKSVRFRNDSERDARSDGFGHPRNDGSNRGASSRSQHQRDQDTGRDSGARSKYQDRHVNGPNQNRDTNRGTQERGAPILDDLDRDTYRGARNVNVDILGQARGAARDEVIRNQERGNLERDRNRGNQNRDANRENQYGGQGRGARAADRGARGGGRGRPRG